MSIDIRIYVNIGFRATRRPLTSDGFVLHFPFPEHSKVFAWLSPGTQVLAFTTRVKRKATIDLVMESFTKPGKKEKKKEGTIGNVK